MSGLFRRVDCFAAAHLAMTKITLRPSMMKGGGMTDRFASRSRRPSQSRVVIPPKMWEDHKGTAGRLRPGPRNRRKAGVAVPLYPRARTVVWTWSPNSA